MTYAKFGLLCRADPTFIDNFNLVVCDELHTLIKFVNIDREKIVKSNKSINVRIKSNDKEIKDRAYSERDTLLSLQSNNYYTLEMIKNIVLNLTFKDNKWIPAHQEERRVLALTATPQKVYQEFKDLINEVTANCELFAWRTLEEVEYQSIITAIKNLKKGEKGIIYASRILELQKIENICQDFGFKTISLWSPHNTKNPLNEEQINVRTFLLENQSFPEEYDILLINEAYATSINICQNEKLKKMIIYNSNKDIQTQARGRYRGDLDILYLHQSNGKTLNTKSIEIPINFLEKPLDVQEKKELAKLIGVKRKDGTAGGWTVLKKLLLEQGYQVIQKNVKGHRCDIISIC